MRSPLSVIALVALLGGSAAPAGAQPSSPPAYLDIVRQYASGDYDAAVQALIEFPQGRLADRVFDQFQRVLIGSIGDARTDLNELSPGQRVMVAQAWAKLVPAAAVLHMEVALYHLTFDKKDVGINHLYLARTLVDWSRWEWIFGLLPLERKPQAQLRRDVYLGMAWTLQDFQYVTLLVDHLGKARDAFPSDAELLLASGSAEELLAKPAIVIKQAQPGSTMGIPADAWRNTVRQAHLDKAEDYHRAAIARDPALAEAHMRLGHVLQLRDRRPEARRSLETARGLKPPADIGYLAALFLAALTEDEGQEASAFEQYLAITKQWPECQAGHMGLSRAYEARGDRQAALGALHPLWRGSKERACQYDPWWVYDMGQAWRMRAHFEALRERVRVRS